MIQSFGDAATRDIYDGIHSRDARRVPPDIHKAVFRKLDMIEGALKLEDLRSPPNNHSEALKHDLAGWHSIRVNTQWRIIFRWCDGNAEQGESG